MTDRTPGMFHSLRQLAAYVALLVIILVGLVAGAWQLASALWRGALWLLVAVGLAGCTYDPGGSIYERAAMVRDEYRVLENNGTYASAATMHLANGCVQPGATLVFHLPKPDRPQYRALMAAHYPPALAAWFLDLPPRAPTFSIGGAQVIALGAVGC